MGQIPRPLCAIVSLFCGATLAAAAPAQTTLRPSDTVLRRVRIIDTESGRASPSRSIIVRGDHIVSVAPRVTPKPGVKVIDGHDAFVIPGLWDAHVHLFQENEQASLDHAARLIGYGITHVRDMGAIPEIQEEAMARIQERGADTPYVYRAGPTLWTFDAPFGDKRQRVVLQAPSNMEPGVAKLVAARNSDFLKVYAGFDRPKLTALAAAAARRGLTLAGHAQPGMTLAEQVRLGMRTIEHVDFSTFAECVPNSDDYFNRVIASRFANSKETIPAIYAEFATKADTEGCRTAMRSAAQAGLAFTPTLAIAFLDKTAAELAGAEVPPTLREGCDVYRRQFNGLSEEKQAQLTKAGKRLLNVMADVGVTMLAGTDAPTFCVVPGASFALELSLLTRSGLRVRTHWS